MYNGFRRKDDVIVSDRVIDTVSNIPEVSNFIINDRDVFSNGGGPDIVFQV